MNKMAASIASSKLLNLRNPALQILLRRHLLHPAAAAAAASASIYPIPASSPHNSSTAINQNFHLSNLPLHFHLPIEAARGYIPVPPNDGGDYDVEDYDDDDDEDVDIEDLSGSEFEDDGEDGDEDDDEIRRPIRK